MVINTGWHDINEIPFIISHEIGHLELGEQGVMYYTGYSGSISEEIQADAYALKMLYEYAKSHGHYFYEPIRFMQVYGIPFRMLGLAKKLFEADGRSKYLTY
ncbi:hypothetical protein [Lactobacillus sp.]|uniref:hypothetical protein n=1 Tax=Lactobacillus sp. TaxID=1591 RepID=UPI0025BA5D12|nr:hypothetical protein [Lactobacillus sp.]